MQIEFQGRQFPVHTWKRDGKVIGGKIMYLNRTRNIAGTVSSADLARLPGLLYTQSVCCTRATEGPDVLEPRS